MKTDLELDPTSDRHRICKYCGKPFMAEHRSMIFHDPVCADEFHNRKKRLEKEGVIQESSQEQVLQENIENILALDAPDKAQEELGNNIRILDQLELVPLEGTVFRRLYGVYLKGNVVCFCSSVSSWHVSRHY